MNLPDFDAIRRDHREWRDESKKTFVNGVDPTDLKPGMLVTISPNLRNGDRSWATDLLEVVAVNSAHVQVKFDKPFISPNTILLVHEHHFYRADGFERAPQKADAA